jgi:hypothetical protein
MGFRDVRVAGSSTNITMRSDVVVYGAVGRTKPKVRLPRGIRGGLTGGFHSGRSSSGFSEEAGHTGLTDSVDVRGMGKRSPGATQNIAVRTRCPSRVEGKDVKERASCNWGRYFYLVYFSQAAGDTTEVLGTS